MSRIVLFAVGSPLCVDFEESVFRAGLEVAAGIKNVEGPDYLTEGTTIVSSCQLDDALLRLPYLVPLFTPKHRIAAQREAESLGFDTPASLIDASVILPKHLALEGGSYINAGCVLGSHSTFGRFTLINRGASIGHHAFVEDFVSIGPGAVLAGSITVEREALIGTGAIVLPSVHIGAGAVVGAGSVVKRDVPARCVVLGNPARIVRSPAPLKSSELV